MSARRKKLLLEFKVAGHTLPILRVNDLQVYCGHIKDGISLEHVSPRPPGEGCWVLSFKDLERLYEAARDARLPPGQAAGEN